MGRLEALIVTLLGRSPYDEETQLPKVADHGSGVVGDGQQYDERGHPVNYETREKMRDHIRASNEVMHTAGIIEETADVQAREKVAEETMNKEVKMGWFHHKLGRKALVAGVWGVLGLRRRILVRKPTEVWMWLIVKLYKSYSAPFLEVVEAERTKYSIPRIIGAGLPMSVMHWILNFTNQFTQAFLVELYLGKPVARPASLSGYPLWLARKLVGYGVNVSLTHFRMLVILQQVNLLPATMLLPSYTALLPFSSYSPLQLPPGPGSIGPLNVLSWSARLLGSLEPLASVFIYNTAYIVATGVFYTLYDIEMTKPYLPNVATSSSNRPSDHQTVQTAEDRPSPDSLFGEFDTALQHAVTLDALEGRASHRDDLSEEGDHEMSQQTLITFDVEASELSEAAVGTWSAQLRSANEPPTMEPAYHVTALTMLPFFFAIECFTIMSTSIVMLPLESWMVRSVAGAHVHKFGGNTGDLYSGVGISWGTVGNVIVMESIQMILTGTIWSAVIMGSKIASGKPLGWGKKADGDEDE